MTLKKKSVYFDTGKTKAECLTFLRGQEETQSWKEKKNVFCVNSLCRVTLERDFWGSFFKIMTDYLGCYAGCYPHFSHIFAHSSYYLQRELVYEIIRVIKAFRAELFPVSTISFHSAFSVMWSRKVLDDSF